MSNKSEVSEVTRQ